MAGEILLNRMGRGSTIVDPVRDFRYTTLGNTSEVNLHSILLLGAVMRSEEFRQATIQDAALLPALFDTSLYTTNAASSNDRDFMHSLMQKEFAYTGSSTGSPLRLFAADLQRLGTEGMTAQSSIQKGLTIAAMEYYYFKDAASATALFTFSGNGIHFKYSDIAAAQYKSLPLLAQAVQSYLGLGEGQLAGVAQLTAQDAWHIQSDSGGLNWTAIGASNDVAIGGAGVDIIDAGAGADILICGAGRDFLTGGAGADKLLGGQDYDTYFADSSDTITDSDGKGVVNLGNSKLSLAERKKGETVYKDKVGNAYLQTGTTLTINGGLKILDWTNGDLGIVLKEKDAEKTKGKMGTAATTPSPIILDLDGDGVETTALAAGAHFDHENDGMAEQTGWARADDGLLVRGNAKIDNGAELFGSETRLANGQKAANGFEALRQLDSNADGKVDASDVAYGNAENIVAAHAFYSRAIGRFDCENIHVKIQRGQIPHHLDSSNAKNAYARSAWVAGRKRLVGRMGRSRARLHSQAGGCL